jgi:hypothetical protein
VSAIAEWLTSLGLSEYTDRFVENGIDTSALPALTDQDLKDLGVFLGHRRKMLRAIRDLGGASVAVTEPSAPIHIEIEGEAALVGVSQPWPKMNAAADKATASQVFRRQSGGPSASVNNPAATAPSCSRFTATGR